MISNKLIKALNRPIEILDSNQEFKTVLTSLSTVYQKFEKHLINITAQNDNINIVRHAEAVKSTITNEIQAAVRISRFSTIAATMQNLKDTLSDKNLSILKSSRENAEGFLEAFDNNLHSHNLETSINLSRAAYILLASLNEIRTTKETILSIFPSHNENQPSLTIYIPDKLDLESFTQKLAAISGILEICCQLLDMSTSEGQVTIEKIESGSLFTKISANPLVIALATIIITNGSQYIFNQADPSKDLNNLKEASEIIEKTLEIRKFLADEKIDTTEIDEEITKSSTILIKHLGRLIKDSSEIEINEKLVVTPSSNRIKADNKNAIEDKSQKK